MRSVMCRLRDRLPHQGRRADHAVEAGVVDHLDDGPDPSALFSYEHGPCTVEGDLGRGIGPIAQLVLEPLDVEGVAGSVWEDARQEKTGKTAGRLGQDEERIAHRCGTEPLVPGEEVLAVRAGRLGARG